MARARTAPATTGWGAHLPWRRRPLRRTSDPTLLLGHAGPLTTGSVAAVVVGVALALTMSRTLAPYAFTLSSVVAVGLLGAARRADVALRPDNQPDRSARSRRAAAAVVVLALIGTGLSAWTIALDVAR
ncbi:MAG: hypothetical protein U5K29_11330 [Acidimicrobiales bacterium]|nr:hypothetical protein [Acidimicrobiales bacterium]